MITEILRLKHGLRKSSPLVSIAAAATPTNVYLLSAGRSAALRKIMISNRNAANADILIGTGLGASFAQVIPQVFSVSSGQDLEITEDQIPDIEFFATMTAQSSAAAASPNDVQIAFEVEEYQGPTG